MNVDVSDIISGHLAYMNEFDIVGKIIDMDREWWISEYISYIY